MSRLTREVKRKFRHTRIRKKISGTSDRPRLYIKRSLTNLYVQLIDDSSQRVLCGLSTLSKDCKVNLKNGGNVLAATKLGELFSKVAKDKGIKLVTFDRGGYRYHGRVKAFADAARQGGLEF